MIMNKETITAIDEKINETRVELDKLRRASELIPNVEANLEALTRTRSILLEENNHKNIDGPVKRPAKRKRSANSIGAVSIEIIKEAGNPLHVKDLVPKLHARGKQVNKATVAGALLRLAEEGLLRKVYPNTYDLADNNQNT